MNLYAKDETAPTLRRLGGVDYVDAQWDGKNTAGLRVVGKAVLVLMDEAAQTTSGGIQLTDNDIEKLTAMAVTGVLVAVSPGAFLLAEDGRPWEGIKPQAGDRVYVQRYAGHLVPGRDGRIYRIMDYGNIGAVYEEQ